MPKHGTLIAALGVLYLTMASVAQPAAMECKKVPGMIAGPMVPTPDVAREIYLAVAKGRRDEILLSNVIKVHDDGERWSVLQVPAQPKGGERGGGTLEMTIGKCDGSILAHYSR
jgi:hypothetical protein